MAPFCSCPASLVSRKFFAVGPGCAKCFFCCAPLGAATFRRGQSKKKHTTRVFFVLLRPRGKAGEGEAPCRHGASPSPAFPRGRSKKKNTLGGVFFLLPPRADAHSLTAGLGGDASPSPGWCFLFLLRPRPDQGGVFFCCGPARTLTHSLWAGAISARPGWCFFFLLRPRRVFLDNNKKCLGYYSAKPKRGLYQRGPFRGSDCPTITAGLSKSDVYQQKVKTIEVAFQGGCSRNIC